MAQNRPICLTCAWRNDCIKKYSFQSSGLAQCPEYTEDIRLKKTSGGTDEKKDR